VPQAIYQVQRCPQPYADRDLARKSATGIFAACSKTRAAKSYSAEAEAGSV